MKPALASRASVASRFRTEIEGAAAAGADRNDLALHLTLGDVAHLTRDRTVPVADISYADGTMTYLGVKVVKGGVESSVLRGPDAAG